jgi:hypothetical protein
MKRICIRFAANKTGFIRLFCIEANQRILYAKQIKKEANIPFFVNIFFFRFKANILTRNEAKNLIKSRILIGPTIVKGFPILKQYLANIRLYANICKQIFASKEIF